jgi:hypothetical protein
LTPKGSSNKGYSYFFPDSDFKTSPELIKVMKSLCPLYYGEEQTTAPVVDD